MQNAPSGHISSVNRFHLEKSLLLGLRKDEAFPGDVLVELIKDQDQTNIKMEGVIVDDFITSHKHSHVHPLISAKQKPSPMPDNLKTLSVFFGQSELSFLLLDENIQGPEDFLAQTAFKDLFVTNFANADFIIQNNEKLLFNSLCPVIVLPQNPLSINHIIFYFDGLDSSVKALRKFIGFFHNKVVNTSMFAFLLNMGDDPSEAQKERTIVNYLLENFEDVGVQTVTKSGVMKDITRIINYYPNCCIVTGSNGAKSILHTNIANLLAENNVPLFYCN